jgi:hypothetical protein
MNWNEQGIYQRFLLDKLPTELHCIARKSDISTTNDSLELDNQPCCTKCRNSLPPYKMATDQRLKPYDSFQSTESPTCLDQYGAKI